MEDINVLVDDITIIKKYKYKYSYVENNHEVHRVSRTFNTRRACDQALHSVLERLKEEGCTRIEGSIVEGGVTYNA
jgi:hypothetical protein